MKTLKDFEGTQEQLNRFNMLYLRFISYIKVFDLNDVQESVAANDLLRYEEETESVMTFDTFKERLTIRECNE